MLIFRALIREILSPFAFALVILGSLMTTGFVLFGLIEDSARFHYSLWSMAQIVVLRLPEMLYYTLPMAVLLATLLAVSRLSADQELLILRLMGVSLWKFTWPFVVFSLGVASLTVALNETLVPPASWLARQVLHEAQTGEITLPQQAENLIYRDLGPEGLRQLIYARYAHTGQLEQVVVEKFTDQKLDTVLLAKRAEFKDGLWQFHQGTTLHLRNPDSILRGSFDSYQMALPAALPQLLHESRQPAEMNLRSLAQQIALLQQSGANTQALRVRWQQKIAVPFAAVVFALLGVVLGAQSLRSKSQGFGISLGVIFLYYLLMSLGTALGDDGKVPAWLGAWLPHLCCLPLALGMLAHRNQQG